MMRTLHLDYQAARPASWIGISLLMCGLLLLGVVLFNYRDAKQNASTSEAKIAKAQGILEKRERKQRSGGDGPAQRIEEIAAANVVINRLSLPWDDLFSAFELATNNEVALLAIEPDAEKRVVTVSAESKNSDDMLAYIKRLERSGLLNDVLLQKHELQVKDPERPLRFVVTSAWKDRK